jgi:hypothetical protein
MGASIVLLSALQGMKGEEESFRSQHSSIKITQMLHHRSGSEQRIDPSLDGTFGIVSLPVSLPTSIHQGMLSSLSILGDSVGCSIRKAVSLDPSIEYC